MTDTLTFKLSQEELLYLLRSLELPDLPGMGKSPWGTIPAEAAEFVLEAAGRSLIGRGILYLDEQGKPTIDASVRAALNAGTYPDQMVILTFTKSDQFSQYHYYRVAEFDVSHTLPGPWMHEFNISVHRDMGLAVIDQLAVELPPGFSSNVLTLKQSLLDEIRRAAIDSPDEAMQILSPNGLPESASQALLKALANPKLKMLVQVISQLNPTVEQNVFTLLSDEKSNWLVTGDSTISENVAIKAVNADEARRVIKTAYQALLNK